MTEPQSEVQATREVQATLLLGRLLDRINAYGVPGHLRREYERAREFLDLEDKNVTDSFLKQVTDLLQAVEEQLLKVEGQDRLFGTYLGAAAMSLRSLVKHAARREVEGGQYSRG